MKKSMMKKSNIVLIAVIVVAVVAGVWLLLPGISGGNADGSGVAAGLSADSGGSGDLAHMAAETSPQDGASGQGTSAGGSSEQGAPYGSYGDTYAQSGSSSGTGDTGDADNTDAAGDSDAEAAGDAGDGTAGGADGPSATLSIDADTMGYGYIMEPRTIYFTEGETVFGVLYRECRDSGIHMSSRFTPIYDSAYIEGIDNLYEFDGGELSGWMYNVNGWYPNYGCSKYALQDGDVIQWRYTCDLGRDIGGEDAAQG